MIGFALKYWRYITIILGVLSVLGTLWGYGHTKYREGYKACEQAQQAQEIEGIKNREKIRTKITRLPDTDLDTRLRKWLLP